MNNKRNLYMKLLICSFCMMNFLLIFSLSAQGNFPSDSLCAYTWNSDLNDCPDVLDCIYPGSWQDTVVQVPANVTRISRNGFKLCLEDIELQGTADIIYIMDLSYSMSPNCTPDKKCPNNEYPGDPDGKRYDALKAGFDYQSNNSKQSKAGYIGFASGVLPNHVLSPVFVNTERNQLDTMLYRLEEFIKNDVEESGTNYYLPLNTAISWLQDTSISPNENKAIIFISDGRPISGAQTDEQVNFLKNNKIPVYGIFLGREMEDDLLNLSVQTGGTAYLVPPSSTDTLETVVKNIVKNVTREYQPKSLEIKNITTNDTATGESYEKLGDTAWAAQLNRFVPLLQGPNLIQIASTFGADGGTSPDDTTLGFTFEIDVSGELNQECYFCWPRTKLEALINNNPVDTLSWKNDSFTVKLSYFGPDTLDSAIIIIESKEKKDYEVITIHDGIFDGNALIFKKELPFSISTIPPQPNKTIEADADDNITLFWKHPIDALDTASASVIVANNPYRIRIYDRAGDPSNGTPLANPPETDTVTTDTPTPLFAKAFTNLTKWLPEFETDSLLTRLFYWNVTDTNGTPLNTAIGRLSSNNSNTTSFIADSAYNTVHIAVSLDIGIGFPLSDTIRLFIGPGAAKQLVIENSNDINITPDLNKPVPLDPIHIYNNMTEYPAYAILRDAKGNWIGPAKKAIWRSNESTIAKVTPGPNDTGIISRGTLLSGRTGILAKDGGLEDTAGVYIWDNARLEVLYNNVLIDTLSWYHKSYTVRLTYCGHDTLDSVDILVDTKNMDKETVTINGFTVNNNAFVFEKTVPFKVQIDSIPAIQGNDTTEAKINDTVSLFWKHPYAQNPPDSASASVPVSNNPVLMRLYKEAGDPASLTPYSLPPATDTITSDGLIPIFAKAFTSGNRWLPLFETDENAKKLFTWSVTDTNGSPIDSNIGRLSSDSTNENYFEADMAYKTVVITAFLDVGIGYPISCSVRFYIKPGIPAQIVIEATNDITKTTDLHNPAPWDPIDIWGNMSQQIAYAILRDADGNWVSPAINAVWTVNDAAVASSTPGPGDSSVITKGILPEGSTGIHAAQDGFRDTSKIITHHYSFESLRIARVHGNDTSDIQNLTMEIYSDTMLVVEGKRTDNGNWTPVDANWSIDSIATNPNPPAVSSFWRFTAITPVQGIIAASLSLTDTTLTDTVYFNFIIPSLSRAKFTILTPDSLRIAGRVITAEVSIYHANGLIPGIWKYPKGNVQGGNDSAIYLDKLGNNGLSYIPYVKTYNNGTLEDSSNLNDRGKVVQTFNNGKDTLEFVLYYAPWQGHKHQLVVHLDSITAVTEPFILHPGPIDTIHLIDSQNIHFPDTLSLTASDSSFMIKAMGYDLYGNYLKNEPYTWKNDPNLVDYSISSNLDWIYFEPYLAKNNQEGHVTVNSNTDPAVSNNTFIIVKGPRPAIISAITRDFTGNGLLDAIEVKFNKSLTLPPDFDVG
ncbi:MAG: vWA domain-containing protein, partial [Chitinispirillia bacterium]